MLAAQTPSSTSHAGDLRQHELQLDPNGKFTSFGHYMHAKVSKLMHQVHDNAQHKSKIFSGISIYVNGYTDPPALELRRLIVENGGEYHHYYFYGQTTYMVATCLSVSKWKALRVNEKVIRPNWLTECVKAGELLPEHEFLLRKPNSPVDVQANNFQKNFAHSAQSTTSASTTKATASVSEFYMRSRLHLISTLAQDLKQFVSELRRNAITGEFPSRQRLTHLSAENSNRDQKPIICHIDMDCFFVSVALRSRPELRGKPVAITHSKSAGGDGKKGGYGEIASCSYEARAFGVKSAMLVNRATALCPALICLPYQFDEYRETSKLLYSTIARYTLNIRAVSCDEMYINLTDLCSEMGIVDPLAVMSELRREVFEVTQCNASAGIGSNVLLARLATKKAKPNGQYWIRDSEVSDYMKFITVRDLPGVGYAMEYKLCEAFGDDLKSCHQIQQIPLARLQAVCGEKNGQKLFESCRGICRDELETDSLDTTSTRKSVSCDVNFGIRMSTKEELWKFFEDVGAQLASKLDALGLNGSSLTLKLMIRAPDAPIEPAKYGAHGICNNISKTFLFAEPTRSPRAIFSGATRLAVQLAPVISDIRGIGLQMTRLVDQFGSSGESSVVKRHERELGQPSIKDFLRIRKTPSPNICEQSASILKTKDNDLPRKLPLAKPPKSTTSKYLTTRKKTTKRNNVMPRRVNVHRRILHTLIEAPAFSKDLTSAKVEVRDGLLLVGSIEIAYREEASKTTVECLLLFFTRLVRESHFSKVTTFFSFLQRNLFSLQDTHPDWLVVVTELKSNINLISLQFYDSTIFD